MVLWVVLSIVALGVVGALLVRSPFVNRPIARFLAKRHHARAQLAVADYVSGRVELDSAARRLSEAMNRASLYEAASIEPGAGSRAEIQQLGTPGSSADNEKIWELYQRATYLQMGPERYRQMQDWLQQQRDVKRERPEEP